MPSGFKSLSPVEARERLDGGRGTLTVIDVREPVEFELARVEGARLVPLATLPQLVPLLDPKTEIACLCHHGVRSQYACAYLAQAGFERVWNVEGGIDLWSIEADPSIPRY